MSNYYYADGAIHNDHHKEMNISGNISRDDVDRLVEKFFADAEDAVVAEAALPDHNDSFGQWLEENNKNINLDIILRGRNVHRTALWLFCFIKEHFVQPMQHTSDWYALYKFLNDKGYLVSTDVVKFVEQMNVWFESHPVRCQQTEISRYSFLTGYPVSHWPDITKDDLKNRSGTNVIAVGRIYTLYTSMTAIHDAMP